MYELFTLPFIPFGICELREPGYIIREAAARKQRRMLQASTQSIEEVSYSFAAAVKDGPDYVCTCCHRLMYQKTVIDFRPTKHTKLPEELSCQLFPPALLYTSAQQKVWVWKMCDYSLKRGNMPAQAKANNLVLQPVPPELEDLMQPNGSSAHITENFFHEDGCLTLWQAESYGPAVNVPADLHPENVIIIT